MDNKEVFLKYFTDYDLKNIFLPLEEIADTEAVSWIAKSKHELNRYAGYLCLLGRYGKDPVDKYICQAVIEAITGCSGSIIFSIFNIFSILTNTERTFYDTHIQEYFSEKMNLKNDDSHYLTFKWHEPVEKINSMVYSTDEELIFFNQGDDLMFQIRDTDSKKSTISAINENSAGFISSKEFFAINLLNLLAAIDVLADLLHDEILTDYSLRASELPTGSSHILIENIDELKSIFRAI